jgi:hypothetical protein
LNEKIETSARLGLLYSAPQEPHCNSSYPAILRNDFDPVGSADGSTYLDKATAGMFTIPVITINGTFRPWQFRPTSLRQ